MPLDTPSGWFVLKSAQPPKPNTKRITFQELAAKIQSGKRLTREEEALRAAHYEQLIQLPENERLALAISLRCLRQRLKVEKRTSFAQGK